MQTFCKLFADDSSIQYSSEKIDVIERNKRNLINGRRNDF